MNDSYDRIKTFVDILPLKANSPYIHFDGLTYETIEILSINIDNGILEIINENGTEETSIMTLPPYFVDKIYEIIRSHFLST